MTKSEAQAIVLEVVAAHGTEGAQQIVTQWCNASEVEIDDKGDIWIANPQKGHWLSEDMLIEFAEWCEHQ